MCPSLSCGSYAKNQVSGQLAANFRFAADGQPADGWSRKSGAGDGARESATFRAAIVADDLTGSCDAGVHFAVRGMRTRVLVNPEAVVPAQTQVVVYNTNSRCAGAEVARAQVMHAASAACQQRPHLLFKKIDSTFRGHAGEEIATMLDTCNCSLAIVAPTFPEAGRTVCGGRVRVHGIDAEIEISAFLSTLLWAHAAIEDVARMRERVEQEIKRGTQALVVDATDRDHLHQIALLEHEDLNVLWVGSGGLARALAEVCAHQDHAEEEQAQADAPVLICVGSDHSATTAQIQHLAEERDVIHLAADDAGYAAAQAALRRGDHVVLSFSRNQIEQQPDMEMGDKLGMQHCGALIATGGDTALYVLRSLGVQAIELRAEIQPGIPWGRMVGGTADGMPVVTKSGAFGQRRSLLACIEFFQPSAGRRQKADVS